MKERPVVREERRRGVSFPCGGGVGLALRLGLGLGLGLEPHLQGRLDGASDHVLLTLSSCGSCATVTHGHA